MANAIQEVIEFANLPRRVTASNISRASTLEMSLDGHIVLITGAGQGIGKACTFAFAEKGADPIVWDKTSRPLERLFVN